MDKQVGDDLTLKLPKSIRGLELLEIRFDLRETQAAPRERDSAGSGALRTPDQSLNSAARAIVPR
jgi:hypothetical protein